MTEPDPDPAAETRRLLAALQEWTQRTFPAPPSGHGGPECQWCPLCQLAAALRGEYPELTERLTEAGTAVAAAIRALAEAAPARGGTRAEPGTVGPDQVATRPEPRPRVQRISLDEPTGGDQDDE